MYQSIFLPAIWPKAWHTPTQTQTQTHHIHMCEYRCEQWTERQWSRFMCAWNLYDNWISVIARILNTFAYDVPRLFSPHSSFALYIIWYMWLNVNESCVALLNPFARYDDIETLAIRLLYSLSMALKSLTFLWICVCVSVHQQKKILEYACETISLDCAHFAFMQMQTTETICWCWWQ